MGTAGKVVIGVVATAGLMLGLGWYLAGKSSGGQPVAPVAPVAGGTPVKVG